MRFRCDDGRSGRCGCNCCRGNVLPLVLVVLLVLSILAMAMLRVPGTLRRTVAMVARETQEMYWAESAVLSKLEGAPNDNSRGLPTVEEHVLGPWSEWRTRWRKNGRTVKFKFVLGNSYGHFATSEWTRCAVLLERNLQERILQADGLRKLSGNRRFFQLDSSMSGRGASSALHVSAGDLTLDLGGSDAFSGSFGDASDGASGQPSVHSFMANVEGDVKIRGNVHFDTLRIYATGMVTVLGNVSAAFVEIFGFSSVTVSGNVSFAGVLLSKQSVEISEHAQLLFPSVAVAVGYRGNRVSLREKSSFEGLAIAPSGVFERDSSTVLLDSSKALLPFCMESRKVVFERRRLW